MKIGKGAHLQNTQLPINGQLVLLFERQFLVLDV